MALHTQYLQMFSVTITAQIKYPKHFEWCFPYRHALSEKMAKSTKSIRTFLQVSEAEKNPEWGTGIMDNVYMMNLLRMFFLKATFKQKKHSIKNVEDYSSKE